MSVHMPQSNPEQKNSRKQHFHVSKGSRCDKY